jgi:hypothetical protein
LSRQLSKSKILSGLQCEKRLHQEVHHPERAEGSDSSAQIIEQGKRIGELACQQYPN